jgi:hypothetical protein
MAAAKRNGIIYSPGGLYLLLGLLTLFAYAPVPWNEFVNYDESD